MSGISRAIDEANGVENYRVRALIWLFALSFVGGLVIQSTEVLSETFLPGAEDTLNEIHIYLRVASGAFVALLLVFGPIDGNVFPSFSWNTLLWTEVKQEDGTIKKVMDLPMRCIVVAGLFGMILMIMLGAYTLPG